ncbi:hypothetical protein H7F15_13225 [Pontibacter sp. Tf4]|uniref:hypothetical protein n=1 Tax=Pontibacter sp. Tf4 TaxID=2761620 RepID=UPI0016255D1F|nr:hypothetical protein [Pontibacter sp. Tf4]MBB6612005.1 hypothetical protein [Pontibacter sp. Tf4]
MIKIFTPILLLLSVISLQAAAQASSFEKGYVVQEGDTLHGFIRNVPETDLTKSIEFKKEFTAEKSTVYTPLEISSFSFGNSGIVYSAVEAEILKGATISRVQRFAKLMTSGYTQLYKLPLPQEEQSIVINKYNTNLYILKKDGTYYTLGLYETLSEGILKTNARYKGTLRAIFSDCKDYKDNLDRLAFNDKSIMDEVGKYNACMAPKTQTQIHTVKTKAVVKHGLEAFYTKGSKPDDDSNYEGEGYAVGYFWDIIHSGTSRQLSGKIGLGVMSYSYTYYRNSFFSNYNDEKVSESALFLRVPIVAQYNFGDAVYSNVLPFLSFGVTTLLNVNSDSNARPEHPGLTILNSVGAGMYYNRIRLGVQLENHKLSTENLTTLNFSLGFRIDN